MFSGAQYAAIQSGGEALVTRHRTHQLCPLDDRPRRGAHAARASPSSVYRVLQGAGVLGRWTRTPSKKGTGLEQPTYAHAHWPIDCTYINIAGTFYYLCAILDG